MVTDRKTQALIALGLLLCVALGIIYFMYKNPTVIQKEVSSEPKIVYINPEQATDAQVVKEQINSSYTEAAEIVRDIPKTSETKKPETKPDAVIKVPTNETVSNGNGTVSIVTKQYNIVYDRKNSIGYDYTNQWHGVTIGHKPEHWLEVDLHVGKTKNNSDYYGVGVKYWF